MFLYKEWEDYVKFHSLVPIFYLGKILLKEAVPQGEASVCIVLS